MTIDHEICSKRLRPYVRDELPPSARAEVEEHLSGCAECRAEETALRAIGSEPVQPMTDLERTRLRRTLRDRLAVPEEPARSPLAWVPGVLAVAAVLLAIVVGIRVLPGVGGGDDEADSATSGGADAAGPVEPRTYSLRDGSIVRAGSAGGAGGGAAVSGGGDGREISAGAPSAVKGGELSEEARDNGEPQQKNLFTSDKRRLGRIAERGRILQPFAGAYTATDIPTLRDGFLDVLAADAPDPAAGRQIADCDALVTGTQETPMLPVIAAHGRFEGRPALLLAYLTSADGDSLTRSAFFVWPRGDCSIPLLTQFGEVP